MSINRQSPSGPGDIYPGPFFGYEAGNGDSETTQVVSPYEAGMGVVPVALDIEGMAMLSLPSRAIGVIVKPLTALADRPDAGVIAYQVFAQEDPDALPVAYAPPVEIPVDTPVGQPFFLEFAADKIIQAGMMIELRVTFPTIAVGKSYICALSLMLRTA